MSKICTFCNDERDLIQIVDKSDQKFNACHSCLDSVVLVDFEIDVKTKKCCLCKSNCPEDHIVEINDDVENYLACNDCLSKLDEITYKLGHLDFLK